MPQKTQDELVIYRLDLIDQHLKDLHRDLDKIQESVIKLKLSVAIVATGASGLVTAIIKLLS